MIRRFFREVAVATELAEERARLQQRQHEMQLISFSVQWGRVHYHVERMKYPSLYDTPAECLRRGQEEAIKFWKNINPIQAIECVTFISAFMDGWKQGMEEW